MKAARPRKREVVTAGKFPIRKRNGKWQVDYRKIGGKQVSYATKTIAQAQADMVWRGYQTGQLTGVDLTPERRQLAIAAFSKLAAQELADSLLLDAVDLYAEQAGREMQPRLLADVVTDYLKSRQGAVEAITLNGDYRVKLGRLARSLGEREIHAITTAQLEQWLNDNEYRDTTRMAYRTRFVMLWDFAIARNHTKQNVARAIPQLSRQRRKKLRAIPPAIMDAEEVQRLLDTALSYRDGVMLPYFAVCSLAGLRPWEARRLSWANVDLEKKEMYIPAEASKTGDDREVPMPNCLVDWLEQIPVFRRRGTLPWNRQDFITVRKMAGVIQRWKEPKGKDILRHSAASHDFRLHGNMAQTAAKMGHDVTVFKNHYKSRVRTRDEAEAYFNVRPPAGEIVALTA